MKRFSLILWSSVLLGQAPAEPHLEMSLPAQGGIRTGYRLPRLPQVKVEDGPRWQALVKDGKVRLSLNDAIALALENNLDLELSRYAVQLADTDVLRSRVGLTPRGIPISVRESPTGLGGPVVGPNGSLGGGDSPALNALVGPGVQVDLTTLGSIPIATGAAIPNLDPVVTAATNYTHVSTIQNSTFLPNVRSLNASTYNANLGFQQGFLTGGTVNLFWNNSRTSLNSPLVNYNPTVSSVLGISVTQPLLRGFGRGVNQRYIRVSKNNRRVSETVFSEQLIAVVSGVVRLYWDLVSLRGDSLVREDAVKSAEKFLRDSEDQFKNGTMAQIDVTRAQAELSRRKRDLAVANTLVRQQETVLKDYLTRGRLPADLAGAPLETTDSLLAPADEEPRNVEELAAAALERRPELRQVRLQLENAQLNLKGSQNAIRPELDFVATAQGAGFAGQPARATSITDPLILGGYGDALSQIGSNNFPSYSAGVQLALPLRNRAARADAIRDEITVRQQQVRGRQLEKQVRVEVTNAVIAVQQARETYEATKSERIFQEQSLSAEEQKLQVGASTSLAVIQGQRDLSAARSAEITALASYYKARTALQRALGTTLSEYRIDVDEAFRGGK